MVALTAAEPSSQENADGCCATRMGFGWRKGMIRWRGVVLAIDDVMCAARVSSLSRRRWGKREEGEEKFGLGKAGGRRERDPSRRGWRVEREETVQGVRCTGEKRRRMGAAWGFDPKVGTPSEVNYSVPPPLDPGARQAKVDDREVTGSVAIHAQDAAVRH